MAAMLTAPLAAQTVTTSGVNGQVLAADGSVLPGVPVTLLHEPTGTLTRTVSTPSGLISVDGLRPGGPYTITAQPANGTAIVERDVYLELGKSGRVTLRPAKEEVVTLEKLEVTADAATGAFASEGAGSSSFLTSGDLARRATVRRNIQDYATLDTRLNLSTLDRGGQLSAQGKNFRYNSFLVDGVAANDSFGLNDSGFATRGTSPVPVDSIEAMSAELTPYDVARSGFTGALINVVTKSGTNDFSGSLYTFYSDKDMRGENPVSNLRPRYKEVITGGTFGGPIVKDRLFFFLTYQETTRESVAASTDRSPNAAAVTSIRNRASALGYETGELGSGTEFTSEQLLAKVDWNITDAQRLSVTYSKDEVLEPVTPGFNTGSGRSVSFENYWYNESVDKESISARLNSTWTPDFSTEATYSHTTYDGTPQNRGKPFPQVTIRGIPTADGTGTGSVVLGTENSRQSIALETTTDNGAFSANYIIDKHKLTAGVDAEKVSVTNLFNQNIYGNYTYGTATASGLNAWLAGTAPTSYSLTLRNAQGQYPVADWEYAMTGLFLQDRWQVNSRLTLTGGLRLDYPFQDAPAYNPAVKTTFGRNNNETIDGNYLVAPRISFDYDAPVSRPTRVRGGFGLFQGRSPAVWLSNSYTATGLASLAGPTISTVPTVFNPDPLNQSSSTGSLPSRYPINMLDDDFRMPSDWKGNVGVDHELPWWDLVATAEFGFTQTNEAIFYQNLNMNRIGFLPDGRERYNGPINVSSSNTAGRQRENGFGDVFLATNTSKGESQDYTFKIEKPWKKSKWFSSLSYTYTRAYDVSPVTSSVAGSNWNTRASFNPNEEVTSTSNYEIPHRIVMQLARRFEFIDRAPTTIGITAQRSSGRPYSYTYVGDANGDGINGNDLLYVPTYDSNGNLADSKVRFGAANPTATAGSTANGGNNLVSGNTAVGGFQTNLTAAQQAAAFKQFSDQSGLSEYEGNYAPRNSFQSRWVSTLDINITQEIPLYNKLKAELLVNLINVGNMLNNDWGRTIETEFPLRRNAAAVGFDSAANAGAGQYVYAFDPASTSHTLPGTTTTAQQASVWQVQVGMRIRF